MRQGKTQAGVTRISKMAEKYPQNAGLRVLLAAAYFNLNDLDKAESNVRQALVLDPKIKDAYTLLGNIDLSRGSADQAKTHFRDAIEADPSGLANYLVLENEYEREGNWEEARKVCEKARQINPASPAVAFRLARLYLDHGGDVNVAVSLAQVAKQKLPGFPATSDLLGWAYYKLGASDVAIEQLKESVQKDPRNPIYQYHLGMAYLASGRSELAGNSLRRALAEGPGFPEAASARAALDKVSKSTGKN
jgi:tetratricopeptide (TPR) repeat protein